jgi:hypothetical protein
VEVDNHEGFSREITLNDVKRSLFDRRYFLITTHFEINRKSEPSLVWLENSNISLERELRLVLANVKFEAIDEELLGVFLFNSANIEATAHPYLC